MTAGPGPGSEARVPWEDLQDLLRTEDSLLASVAAAALDGLRGTLRAALAAAPADRGAVACTTLLETLDRLLAEPWEDLPATAGVAQTGSPATGGRRFGSPPAGASEDEASHSGGSQGDGARPGDSQGGGARPGFPPAGSAQAGVQRAGGPQPEISRPGAHQVESPSASSEWAGARPAGSRQPENPQVGFPPTGPPQPGVPQPAASQRGFPQPEFPQSGFPPPGPPQPGAPQPGPPKPSSTPDGATTPRVPPRPAAPPPIAPVPTAPPPILALAAELARSPEVDDFATGAVPPAADGTGGVDRVRCWYHLTLLRLPDRHAGVWRARAAGADPAAEEPWRTLRGWADEVLLPPSGDGRAGIRTVREKVTEASDLAVLVLALHEHDDALCLLLDRVWTGGSTRLTDPQVSQTYRGELTKRLESLERSPRDGAERLRASVSVDEALCSVTHLPPGAPGSWWNRLAEESHAAPLDLCRELHSAGRNVEAVLPARPYRQARHHTRAGDDIRLGVGGRPGDTLTCLRLWLRVGDQVFPGRVVYRGQE